jgi:hypothetical protein
MRRVEYRVERIPVNPREPRLLPLVERLTELGRQGWHVAGADLAVHPGREQEPFTVLLEREVDHGHRPEADGGMRDAQPVDDRVASR